MNMKFHSAIISLKDNHTKNVLFYLFFTLFFVAINIPFIRALLLPTIASISIIICAAIFLSYYNYKFQQEKRVLLSIVCFFILFNIAFLVGWFATPWLTPAIQSKEFCLQYISEGTLYEGQPYCHQGPVVYIVARLFQLIPGEEEINFQVGSLLLLTLIFIFLYSLKNKITNDPSLLFFSAFFIFFFIREDDFASLVATLFLVSGVYSLFIFLYRYKEILSGIFLGLAVFSKIYFLLPVSAVLCFYIYECSKTDEKIKLLWRIVNILTPICCILFLFLIWFPNFIFYYYTVHTYHNDVVTLSHAVLSLLDFRYVHNGLFLLFYIGIFISILRFLHKKSFDLFSFVSSVIFSILFILMVKEFYITNISETYRYFFAVMPFYIINLYLFKKEYPQFHKNLKIISFIGVIFFVFIFWQAAAGIMLQDVLDGSVFHEEKLILKIQREIVAPLFELPNLGGKVLASQDYIALFQENKQENPFLYLNATDFEIITEKDPYDGLDLAYVHGLVNMGRFDMIPNVTTTLNLSEINASLRHFSYPIIIASWNKDTLSSLLLENNDYFKSVGKTYCGAAIAMLPGGYGPSLPTRFIVFFLDKEQCNKMKIKVSDYYLTNFDLFCRRGKFTATLIDSTRECTTLIKTTEYMIPSHFRALYLSFFILLFLISQLLFNMYSTIIPFSSVIRKVLPK